METKTKKYGTLALLGVLIIGVLLISGCIGGGPSDEKIDKVKEINESRGCIDFENDTPNTSPVNWYTFHVDSTVIFYEGGDYGNVVRFTDGQGASYAINDIDFGGNWLELADDGCLCFDYKVDWNEEVGSNAGSAPKIGIYAGAPLNSEADLSNRLRASFVGDPNNPLIQDDVWDNFCLPIRECVNGLLPSNSHGAWSVADASGHLTGAAACTAWNTLISDVQGLWLFIDYNAQPSEKVYFDNFCWKCTDETPCVPIEICPEGCTCLSPEDACNESLCNNQTVLCEVPGGGLGFCYETPNNTLIKYCGCLINLQHQDPNLKTVGAPIWITLQEGCNASNENKTFVLDNTLKASNSADYTMNALNCYKPVAIPPGSGGPGTLYWTMWQYMTIGWPNGTSNPPTPNDKKWCVEILVDPNSAMDPPYGEVKNWTIRPERECLNGTCCELSGECGCIVNYQININNPNFMNIKFQPNCNESIQNLSLPTTLVASNAQNGYAPSGSPWGLSTYIDYNPYGTNNMPTITDPNRHWCVKIWRDTNNPNNVIKWEMYPQEENISGVRKCACEACEPTCQGCIKEIVPQGQELWNAIVDPDCNTSTNNDITHIITSSQTYEELNAILENCSQSTGNAQTTGSKTWTTDADFIQGTSMSVNHGPDSWSDDSHSGQGTPHDQLQLSIPGSTYPFIWIPNDWQGTISLVATQTTTFNGHSLVAGTEYGRYLTSPNGTGNPSRTAVDLEGNCWGANRDKDTVIKILNRFITPIVDINVPLDTAQTSQGASYLDWGADDAVVWEVDLGTSPGVVYRPGQQPLTGYTNNTQGLRAVSIDRNNEIWVGGYYSNKHYRINYVSGTPNIQQTFSSVPSYGSVIDKCGFVYVTYNGGMTRINPNDGTTSYVPYGINRSGYGIAIDNELPNRLYTTDYTNKKIYAWDTSNWPTSMASPILTAGTGTGCSGLTVSSDGIWVANTGGNKIMLFNKYTLALIDSQPTNVGQNPVTSPKGVAVDSEGHCWIVGSGSSAVREYQLIGSTITLIGAYDIINSGNSHYAYSDMTGLIANSIAAQHGNWIATYEAPCDNVTWTASWHASTPEYTSLVFSFYTSNDNNTWIAETPTITMNSSNQVFSTSLTTHGKYIKVKVEFLSNPPCNLSLNEFPKPILKDINVRWACKGNQSCCIYACQSGDVIWGVESHIGEDPCCKEQGGRIRGIANGNCNPGTTIQIFDQTTGQIVWTGSTDSSGSYDTGTDCKLTCGKTYKVVLSKEGCTISPPSQIVTISHCCPPSADNPGYETANFNCDCQPHKGRIFGYVTGACNPVTIQIKGLESTNYLGTFVTDLYTGFYQTSPGGDPPIRCILPCPGTYRVTPVPVPGATFSPVYRDVEIKKCCEDNTSYEADFKCNTSVCPSGCPCLTADDAKKMGYTTLCINQSCSTDGTKWCWNTSVPAACPDGCACLPRQSQSNYSFCNNEVIPCNLSSGPGLCFNTSCPIGCKCYTHEEAIKLPNYTSCNKSCLLSNGINGECWKPQSTPACPNGCACMTQLDATGKGFTISCNNQSCPLPNGVTGTCWNTSIYNCPAGCTCLPPGVGISGGIRCGTQSCPLAGGVIGTCWKQGVAPNTNTTTRMD